jgi:plasmid stability protein
MERISVPLTDEERTKLKELAARWSRSESNTARLLLREMLNKELLDIGDAQPAAVR